MLRRGAASKPYHACETSISALLARPASSLYSAGSLMSIYGIEPIGLRSIRTYPLASRKSKVSVREFARPIARGASLTKFLDGLSRILAAEDLRHLLVSIHAARAKRKAILWGMGGHVIKVGLGPVLIDLMRRGFVSGIAMNGAALIHDFEIALVGNTSEDVEAGLGGGKVGMAAETGLYLNENAVGPARSGFGLGEAAGKMLTSGGPPAEESKANGFFFAFQVFHSMTLPSALRHGNPP